MSEEIISGWKDIASYLGKGVRTVQRYERGLGLPVRCQAGKSNGSVVATKAELGAWILASPIREAAPAESARPQDSAMLLNEFRQHVQKLHRLRQESKCLREELHGSLELLRASINLILPEQDQVISLQRRLLSDVPTFDPAKKKAD